MREDKDKVVAKTTALLVLKKAQQLWGETEEEL